MADPVPVSLDVPSKYAPKKSGPAGPSSAPTLDWLTRTWSVTHSTLSMWRTARNVRITYKMLPAKEDLRPRIDDLVEYEPTDKQPPTRKTVHGVDTQADEGGWGWRGAGWLRFVTTHWEVLGWGEVPVPGGETECWAVTWFAPTLFTKEGVDIYCSRREGLSEGTYQAIEAALLKLQAPAVVQMVEKDMQPVEIQLPWIEE